VDLVQWLGLGGAAAAVATFVWSRVDASRAEASAVYVMVTLFQHGPVPPDTAMFTRYEIINDGSQPALSVGVDAWDWGRRRITWRFRRHKHWMTSDWVATGGVYPTITPKTRIEADDLPGLDDWGPAGERPPIMLRFRDGQGRQWVRWPDGKLTRLTPCWFQVEQFWQHRKTRSKLEERRRQLRDAQPPPDP
jgi:hypothetical protein